MKYVRSLSYRHHFKYYSEKPNYEYCKSLFKSNLNEDVEYDWH